MEQPIQRAHAYADSSDSSDPPRTRKTGRVLQWRIPEAGSDPVWNEATDLQRALEGLLDTDEKRAAASRLVLFWQELHATDGAPHAERAGAVR